MSALLGRSGSPIDINYCVGTVVALNKLWQLLLCDLCGSKSIGSFAHCAW
jgi:hypothetical protein